MGDDQQQDLGVVYEDTIDGGMWGCKVVRTAPYAGQLTAWNIESGQVILDEEVGLTADAIFGPDMYDLAEWQSKILASVDAMAKNKSDGETE